MYSYIRFQFFSILIYYSKRFINWRRYRVGEFCKNLFEDIATTSLHKYTVYYFVIRNAFAISGTPMYKMIHYEERKIISDGKK